MAEEKYTWDDIIIDPTSERAKEAIGKECYFDDIPIDCLRNANCDYIDSYGKLIGINNEFKYPFSVGRSYHPCIIVKKQKPYEELQAKWLEENDIKVGDYVKVTRKAKDYEDGWSSIWDIFMNDSVGKVLQVRNSNSTKYGIELTDYKRYPYFVLEKTEEPKPEYVPFESNKEFLERYADIKEKAGLGRFNNNLLKCGMWLKQKELEAYVMITELWDVGVVIGDNKMIIDDEYVCNNTTSWQELLKDFTFIDGTPCGKEAKE